MAAGFAVVATLGVALAGGAFALTRDFRALGLLSAALLLGGASAMTQSERRSAAVIGAVC